MANIQCEPLTLRKLFRAVKNGQLDLIEKPLKLYGIPRSGTRTTDYLILQTALERNHREIAKCLINAGCRVKPVLLDKGLTPLALAIAREDEEIALMILKKGSTIYIGNSTKTSILHLAVAKKSLKMLKLVLACNIDVNLLDGKGKTALQILLENYDIPTSDSKIVETSKIEMVRFLLLRGASVDFKSNDGKTALHHVVPLKQVDITKLLLQKYGDVNLLDNQRKTALHTLMSCDYESEDDVLDVAKLLIEKGVKIDMADWQRKTVCHIAAEKKYSKIICIFILNQCNVSLQDCQNNTTLHSLLKNSAYLCDDENFTDCVDLILAISSLENIRNSDGKTPLHLAAENYHYGILEQMLPKLANVNVTNNTGETLLHILVKDIHKVNYDIIKRLLNAGATVDMKNNSGITQLDLALKPNDTKLFCLMVLHSKNVNQCNFQQSNSILHYLSDLKVSSPIEELKISEIAKSCIAKGAPVNEMDDSLRTPLLAAILNQRKSMVELLLVHGATVNFNKLEDPAIKYLISKQSLSNVDFEIANSLVCKGSKTKFISFKGLSSLLKHNSHGARVLVTKLLENCKNVKVLDFSGDTLLHSTLDSIVNTKDICEEEIVKIVSILLTKGISVDTKNKKGVTALHLAAKNKHNLVSEFLLKSGADITLLDNAGNSVLHFISMLNIETDTDVEKNMIGSFVARGCNVNARNNSGMTPLLTAAQFGCMNVIEALISHGADIEHIAGNGISSTLHVAVEYSCPTAFIELLLRCGANVYNKKKGNGLTAVHIAALHGRLDTLMVLLKNRVHPDVRDNTGRTALHWACLSEKLDVAILLMSMGADANALDNDKITPLMLAQDTNDAMWATLVGHVKRLEVAGVGVAWQNTNCISNDEEQVDTMSLEAAARLEILKMQKTKIDNNYSLVDVLRMKLNRSDIFRDNSAFKKLVLSKDFEKDFPCYSYVIKACFLRGAVRNKLVKEAHSGLSLLSGLALPDICAEEILKFLDNESLINLSQATQMKDSERKKAGSEKEKSASYLIHE